MFNLYWSKRFGVLLRYDSAWIGLHYSRQCKRFCINPLPCFTIWFCKKDGLPVDISKM